jgi:hypothetical protein
MAAFDQSSPEMLTSIERLNNKTAGKMSENEGNITWRRKTILKLDSSNKSPADSDLIELKQDSRRF